MLLTASEYLWDQSRVPTACHTMQWWPEHFEISRSMNSDKTKVQFSTRIFPKALLSPTKWTETMHVNLPSTTEQATMLLEILTNADKYDGMLRQLLARDNALDQREKQLAEREKAIATREKRLEERLAKILEG